MNKGAYISILAIALVANVCFISPSSALGSGEATATPLVQLGTNPNDGGSSGIFIGLKDIKDSQGHIIADAKLAGYQIDLEYDHTQLKVLDVVDEAQSQLGQVAFNNGTNLDITKIAAAADLGTSNFAKLIFVPLALTGTTNDFPTLTIKFNSLTDAAWKPIIVPNVVLTFQRGKIANQTPSGSPNIVDAVAGLQYLSNIVDSGFEQGKVNVVNMASIVPPALGATSIKPSVKDVVSLMQHLVDLRDDSFQIGQGNPAQISLAPNTLNLGYTTSAAIYVTGTSTHFASGTTQLRILDSNKQVVTGYSTVAVQDNTKALIKLPPGLGTGIYTVELTTESEIMVGTFSIVNPNMTLSLSVVGPTSFKVAFNHALTDTANVLCTVQNSGTPVPVTMTWNAAKTEATLTSSSNFPQGTYSVAVKAGITDLGTLKIDYVSPKIAQIKITSTKLAIVSQGPVGQVGYATYLVLDQYGNDVTNSYLANSITFQSGVGTISARNGLIALYPVGSTTNLTQINEVVITAFEPTAGVATSATLSTSSALGSLSDIKLNTLTNADNKVLTTGDTRSTWYIDYTATDVSGNPTKDYNLVKNGLILDYLDQLTISSPYLSASVVQDPNDSTKAAIQVTVTASDAVAEDIPVAITAMTFAGTSSTLNVTLKKPATLDTFTLMPPVDGISVGETKEIPFAAYDQNGSQITKYSDLIGMVTLSGSNQLQLQQNVDGSAKLVAGPFIVSGPQTISAMTLTGKLSTLTLNIHSNLLTQIKITSSKLAIATNSSGARIGYASYQVLDQYGNDITTSYPDSSLSFQSGVGNITAHQGVLTVTPAVGTDLQLLASVLITATDSATGVLVSTTLITSLATLSDLKLNTLTNADNKVLTSGDTASIWYIDYTATNVSGNPTKDYTLVKTGLILGQGDVLKTSSPYLIARLVQDPSNATKAAIQVTVSGAAMITEDTPISITAMTCTGNITTLNVTLKKQSTLDTFTLRPLAYEIAVGETKEMPFAAYDQNGVQITKYADLQGCVTLSGNVVLVANVDGTAKLMVGPFPVAGPQNIRAVTSTGKISTLTLNIQTMARADSLTIDSTVLLSVMQSGSFQTVDFGYSYGGLTVKDQYGRVIDMTGAPGSYQVQATVTVSSPTLTLSSTAGAPGTNPAAYGNNGIRIGANMPGTGTVTFRLIDTANPYVVIDQKSVTFSVLANLNGATSGTPALS